MISCFIIVVLSLLYYQHDGCAVTQYYRILFDNSINNIR